MIFSMIALAVLAALVALSVTGYERGDGRRILWLNELSADKTAGQIVVIGRRCLGVCIDAIAGGEEGTVQIMGLFNMPALSTDTWQAGDDLWWDEVNERLTNLATSNIFAGIAGKKKYALETTAEVVLVPTVV